MPIWRSNLEVCPKCGHHHRIGARARLAMLLDAEGQHEIGAHVTPLDPLKFKDSKKYPDRLKEAQTGTSETDALVVIGGSVKAVDGTLKVVQTLTGGGEQIDWCVIGEPSCTERLGDTIRIGRRGSLTGFLTVKGIEGHVAYPQLARNPIKDFAPVITELFNTRLDEGNEFFPPSSLQIVRIAAGEDAPNVIPGKLEVRFNFRYSTVWTYQRLHDHFEALLRGRGLDFDLRWHLSGEPFLTPVGPLTDGVAAAVEATTGIRPVEVVYGDGG